MSLLKKTRQNEILKTNGDIAHLVEHYNGIVRVVGSSAIISNNKNKTILLNTCRDFFIRDEFSMMIP